MKRLIVFAVAITLASAGASAQLNGLYTIDSSQPTAGTNFANFANALTALGAGVSGPVVFDVYNGTGPYTGFGIATAITGSSASNTITFQAAAGQAPVISGPAAGNVQTIKLGTAGTVGSGPANIILAGLTVQGAASGAAIIAAGCMNIRISRCIAQNCGVGIHFMYTQNSFIEDNEVINCGSTPGTPGAATYVGAIGLADSSSNNVIQRNRIHDCSGNGFFMGGGGSATLQVWNNVVINNFIWNCPGTGTYPGGIALRRITNSTVSNNTVVMPATSANAGLYISAAILAVVPAVGPAAEISNNIVRHLGTGPCVMFDVTTAVVPNIFDYNLYEAAGTGPIGKVATTNYATLASWQAVAAPSLAGKELNSLAIGAGIISNTDLHITPGSPAFNSGSTVALVPDDIDGQPRPLGGVADRGADEAPAAGLFAGFGATPTSGAAPLLVNFTDTSFSSSPGGVTTWAWDFQNDGIDDSFVQNPSFTYTCAGTYSVKLTVADGAFPASTLTRTNLISVSAQPFVMTTTGGGVGDLSINPVPTFCYPTAAQGWTLVSFATGFPAGTGPFGGLYPDSFTIQFINVPAFLGNPIHFFASPGFYPNAGTFYLPPGSFPGFGGVSMDAIEVLLDASSNLVRITNTQRVTF